MDANSKEARRQRKRKTFDDYVFARDIKMTRKKGFKPVEGITIKNKVSYFNKSSDSKEIDDLTKPPVQSLHSGRKIRRRRKALFSTRRSDSYKLKLYHTSERAKSQSFTSNLSSPQQSVDKVFLINFFIFRRIVFQEEYFLFLIVIIE